MEVEVEVSLAARVKAAHLASLPGSVPMALAILAAGPSSFTVLEVCFLLEEEWEAFAAEVDLGRTWRRKKPQWAIGQYVVFTWKDVGLKKRKKLSCCNRMYGDLLRLPPRDLD